jgi:hypothetical protein
VSSVTFKRRDELHDHLQQVAVEHELFERRHQPALHPARGMHHHVAAAHGHAPTAKTPIHSRLGVDGIGAQVFEVR